MNDRLLDALDPAQITANAMRPLPRKRLGRGELVLLIALRVYVGLAIPIVVYAFLHALQAGRL